jgi:hypothetical protein
MGSGKYCMIFFIEIRIPLPGEITNFWMVDRSRNESTIKAQIQAT